MLCAAYTRRDSRLVPFSGPTLLRASCKQRQPLHDGRHWKACFDVSTSPQSFLGQSAVAHRQRACRECLPSFVFGGHTTWRSFVHCQQHANLLRCYPRVTYHPQLEHGVEALLYGGAGRATRLTGAAQRAPERCNTRKAAPATKASHLTELSIHQRPD